MAERVTRAERELQVAILRRLQGGSSVEVIKLGKDLGWPAWVILKQLRVLAENGFVDAHDPPPPCGELHMRWFIAPTMVERVNRLLPPVPQPKPHGLGWWALALMAAIGVAFLLLIGCAGLIAAAANAVRGWAS